MKKILTIHLFSLLAINLTAQEIGIKGGINFGYQNFKSSPPASSYKEQYKMIRSFNGGIIYEIPVTKKIDFQTGIQISGKGHKHSYIIPNTAFTVNKEERLLFIELPLIFKYNFPIGTINFFAGSGPVISYAIYGKTETTILGKFDPFQYYNNRFDAGILFQTGIRVNKISFCIDYNVSIGNLYGRESSLTAKNRVVSFSMGYFQKIGKKPTKP